MLIALLAIIILNKKYKIDFGFSLGDKKLGIKYLLVFTVAVLIFTLISYGIRFLVIKL